MKVSITILLLLALTSCGSGSAPLETGEVQQVLEHHLAVLANGIVREDPLLCSQPVSERFVMGGNIGVRYREAGWEGAGVQSFRSYWDSVFSQFENISISFLIESLDVNGEVATAVVTSQFSGVKVGPVPPESFTADGFDYMVWQRELKGWRLISWDVAPEGAHNQGEGASL
jgi:hypothetical protein